MKRIILFVATNLAVMLVMTVAFHVVCALLGVDPAAAFSGTNAYESGNYLLIDADSDIPFRLLKESSQRSNLKKAVQEITGLNEKIKNRWF